MLGLAFPPYQMPFGVSGLRRIGWPSSERRWMPTRLWTPSFQHSTTPCLTSTTMNRVEVLMANSTLLRRDTHLVQMDPLVPSDDRVTLRASPFVHPSMFSVASRALVKDLETSRTQKKSDDGVKALTNLAKAGVTAKSGPRKKDKGAKSGKSKRKPLERKLAPSKEKEPSGSSSHSRPKKRKSSSFRPAKDGKGKG